MVSEETPRHPPRCSAQKVINRKFDRKLTGKEYFDNFDPKVGSKKQKYFEFPDNCRPVYHTYLDPGELHFSNTFQMT